MCCTGQIERVCVDANLVYCRGITAKDLNANEREFRKYKKVAENWPVDKKRWLNIAFLLVIIISYLEKKFKSPMKNKSQENF